MCAFVKSNFNLNCVKFYWLTNSKNECKPNRDAVIHLKCWNCGSILCMFSEQIKINLSLDPLNARTFYLI